MLRLKANKTRLYKLVREYETLPLMKRTDYTKAGRRPDYWLEWFEWRDGCCLECEAFLSAVAGRAKLAIEKRRAGGQRVSRVIYTLDVKYLRERGMVEEFTPAAERRRTERGAADGVV